MTAPLQSSSPGGAEVDAIISNILRWGLAAATAVMIVGSVMRFVSDPHGTIDLTKFHSEPEALRNIPDIVSLAFAGNSLAVMQLGVVLLLATPFLRVVFAAIAFAREKDWKFVVISLVVLGALITGLLAGNVE